MLSLSYGADATIDLELEGDARVTICQAPHGEPLTDVAGAVRAALAAPQGFPPLAEIALAEDKVALAVAGDVPRAPTVVAETIAVLTAAGVAPGNITVVLAPSYVDADRFSSQLAADVRDQVAMLIHNPRDRQRLSYLAATTAAQPVYLHRAIHDADLVISIGTLQLPGTPDYHGIASAIFPTFSDASTQARYRAPKATRPAEQQRLCDEADEVGWLLGNRFTIQLVPGAEDDVLAVLAGDQQAVREAGNRLCAAAWSFEVPARVELVIATLGSDVAQHTWQNVGRALVSASHVLADQGDIVICSQLDEQPGPGMQRMIGAESMQIALREIAREKPYDSLPAAQLGEALDRGRVYLVSRLDDERLEELGIYPLEADNVPRVTGRYESCVILANAQHAQAWPSDEPRPSTARVKKNRR